MSNQKSPKDRCYFLQMPLAPDPADRSVSLVFSAPLDITYAMREIVGSELLILGGLMSDQDKSDVRKTLRSLLSRNEGLVAFRHRADNGDGSIVWFEGLASVTLSPGSLGVAILSVQAHDVTEEITHRWRSDMELETIRFALSESNLGFWNTDLATGNTWFSDNWYTALGYRPGEFPPSREIFFELLHPEDAKSVGPALGEVEQGIKKTFKTDFRLKCADGSYKWIEAIGGRVEPDASSSPVLCGLHNDIDARKEAERELTIAKSRAELANAELAHSAAHDDLTGLPNRRFFMQRIETRYNEDRKQGQFTTVIRVDLDFFKEINDTIGHDAGDEVLAHVAEILRTSVRADDTVARVGGDEFIALLGPAEGVKEARRISERIISEARKPFVYEDRTCRFGASIGIASTELHPDASMEDLLSYADLALYESKEKGRGVATVFGRVQQKQVVRKSDLIEEVNDGIEAGEFVPYFQPQISAASGEVAGFEVLARWLHPTRGLLGACRISERQRRTQLHPPYRPGHFRSNGRLLDQMHSIRDQRPACLV